MMETLTDNPTPAAPPEAPPLPRPGRVLLALVQDPASVAEVYRWARRAHPIFPAAGSALVLAKLLQRAGFDVPYAGAAERQVLAMRQRGWTLRPATDPPPVGAVFATGAGHQVERVGVVASRGLRLNGAGQAELASWFLAADHLLTDHRPRRVERAEVLYWLSPP